LVGNIIAKVSRRDGQQLMFAYTPGIAVPSIFLGLLLCVPMKACRFATGLRSQLTFRFLSEEIRTPVPTRKLT
jgi:hypothetical protein